MYTNKSLFIIILLRLTWTSKKPFFHLSLHHVLKKKISDKMMREDSHKEYFVSVLEKYHTTVMSKDSHKGHFVFSSVETCLFSWLAIFGNLNLKILIHVFTKSAQCHIIKVNRHCTSLNLFLLFQDVLYKFCTILISICF